MEISLKKREIKPPTPFQKLCISKFLTSLGISSLSYIVTKIIIFGGVDSLFGEMAIGMDIATDLVLAFMLSFVMMLSAYLNCKIVLINFSKHEVFTLYACMVVGLYILDPIFLANQELINSTIYVCLELLLGYLYIQTKKT
jgi:hypothetical protein